VKILEEDKERSLRKDAKVVRIQKESPVPTLTKSKAGRL
jgi:hypothetical protein